MPSTHNLPVNVLRVIAPVDDLVRLVNLDNLCSEVPWDPAELVATLRRKHCSGLIVEVEGQTAAFVIFELFKKRIQLLKLGVHPKFRRRGIGFHLLGALLVHASCKPGFRCVAEVRESNLGAQLFFRSCGFQAIAVMRDYFDNHEDMYQFEFIVTKQLMSLC